MYPILVNRYYYTLAELAGVETGPGPIENVNNFPALLYKIEPIWSPSVNPEQIEKTLFQDYLWPEFYDAPVVYVDTEQEPWGAEVEPEDEEIAEAALPLMGRMHRWYKESYERYSVLIAELEKIKAKLLGPVKVASSSAGHHAESNTGSGSNTGTVSVADENGSRTVTGGDASHLESDTPQNGGLDVFASGYVSKAAKDHNESVVDVAGSTSSVTTNQLANASTTEGYGSDSQESLVANDMDTPIARFKEVQEKLRNLYADWANEFSRFVLQSAE